MKSGVMLINLGTPSSPSPLSVARYLREFLMDPLVIDIAWPFRWALVHGAILPRRPFQSARAYRKVWMEEGSPLLVHTAALARKVQRLLGGDVPLEPAMRYGEPSIRNAVRALKRRGASRIVAFPLYPQYSSAATESSARELAARAGEEGVSVSVLPAFFDRGEFLDAAAAVSRDALAGREFDHYLFSFHGLPERQIRKLPGCDMACRFDEHCCASIGDANALCYRAQCFATARGIAERLGIPSTRYTISFQSRLGRTPWIRPYTDLLLPELPARGIKRVAVFCPSFVADCLETLEEIAIRGRESFLGAGGECLELVPSLNSSDAWADAVASLVKGPLDAQS